MLKCKTSINDILQIIGKEGWSHTIEENELWDDIFVTGESGRTYSIRCNKRNGIVRIHYWMPLDNDIIADNRYRLLQACDITNREMYLKARLFPEGIDIIYEIPERAGESAAYIVSGVLYNFEKYIDQKLFDLALTTDEDLYSYYEEQQRQFHEEIKKRIAEHKKRRQEREPRL